MSVAETPPTSDPAAPFWRALGDGRLEIPRCRACGETHLYPRDHCPGCGSADLAWEAATGQGEVYSYSVVHRAPSPAFAPVAPYVVAIVRLAEGPHLMGWLDTPPERAAIGLAVRVTAGTSPAGPPMLIFHPEPAP